MAEEKGLITKSTLTDIGNAIRAQNGLTTTYKPSEMAAAIKAISNSDNDTCIWASANISDVPALFCKSVTLNGTEWAIPKLQTIAKSSTEEVYTKTGTYPADADTSTQSTTNNILYLIIMGKNFHYAPISGPQFLMLPINAVKAAVKTFSTSFLVVHSSLVQQYAACDGWCNFGLSGIICYDKTYSEPFDFTKKYPS